MRIANFYQQTSIPEYSQALLMTESRKTCTNLAQTMDKTHDSLYKPFRDPVPSKNKIQNELIKIGQQQLQDKVMLLFDDSQISKQYARDIEGLDIGFDGSTGHAELGLQMVTALLTDGRIKIPIDLIPYISKQIAGSHFKTKSEIAAEITTFLIKLFNIGLVLADAHYATKFFLSFLFNLSLAFLMKIPCNRVVTIGSKTAQLKQILRLRKNERMQCMQGYFDGNPYYFYVAKIKNGTTVYFVSLNPIDLDKVIELYRIRWNIELYHRVAKQYLGWKDCQMRAIEKQELHSFFVMYSYVIAEIVRFKRKLNCVEEAIRWLAKVKPIPINHSFFASRENLYYNA